MSSDAVRDVDRHDRPSMHPPPPEPQRRPPAGRRARKSTNAPSWSCPFPEPAPAPACHRHAAYSPPSHSAAALPPTDPTTHCFHPPSPLTSISPVRFRAAHKSRMADKGEDDRHISRPTHAPAAPAPPFRVQWAGSAPLLARSFRIADSSASAAHDGLPESRPARTPTSPKHLRSAGVTLHRNRDKPTVSAHAFGFVVAGARATTAAPVSLGSGVGKFRSQDARPTALSARQPVLVANLPAAVPAVRSAVPVSRSCAQTASAAAGSAAASDARSPSPAAATSPAWQSVPGAPTTAAPAVRLDLTCSDPEVSAPT